MKKIAQYATMTLMLTGIFAAVGTPASASMQGPLGLNPAPMPMCAPGDQNCVPGPLWPSPNAKTASANVSLNPAPMPMCAPGDQNCVPGPLWPSPNAK
jgi:hypothetical protein